MANFRDSSEAVWFKIKQTHNTSQGDSLSLTNASESVYCNLFDILINK